MMGLSKKQKRYLHAVLISLGVLLASISLFLTDHLTTLEYQVDDLKTSLFRLDTQAHDDVIVLLVDEASLSTMDPVVGRWPWPRSVWADVIEYLVIGEANTIVFDILFTERVLNQNKQSNEHDQALVEMTGQSQLVTHAMQVLYDSYNPYADRPLPEGFAERFAIKSISGLQTSNNNTFYIPFSPLYQKAHRMGVVEFSPDGDGVYRRTQLFRDYQGEFYPVLSVASILHKRSVKDIQFTPTSTKFDQQKIPLDRNGLYQVNFYEKFNTYSLASVLASSFELRKGNLEALYTSEHLLSPEVFKDKIIFIGTSAVGLEDLKTTPIDSRWPGVFLHAAIASNLLLDDFIIQVPTYQTLFLMLFATSLIFIMLVKFNSLAGQLALPLGLILLFTTANLALFNYANIQLDLIPVLLSVTVAWLLLVGYFSATEGQERRRVRHMLLQYVSPAALSEVLDNYEDQLQAQVGALEEMSIVFSDIRSFTSISEHLSAQKVVKMLNIHLEIMTQITFEHRGTMDKFIGDATMAFWGAPLEDKDHAYNATVTAIDMHRAIPRINQLLKEQDLPAINIGVGVNTGQVVLGNIGSSQKLDYTIIGDAVNLGSRLEALTKEYQLGVLISEFTWQKVNDRIPCLMVDSVRVKGREKPIRIFSPLAYQTDAEALISEALELQSISEQAFKAYHNREFEKALELFLSLPEAFDGFKQVFKARCEHYIERPPIKGWDGVFIQTRFQEINK
ncbi:MAG: CHASE2 domain-containing protein [Thiomicrospira sp.]|uniref:CHASE2 domain-containing protein n=1 Tax=Thiomicrospira sp. TaxID=935 RepID=UPI001A067C3A|nr:adenylate/guanylate cyclase domain-containing protein [Thiomicrospira sp.]MBE0494588.1 CHASE2 domain-containing protein [Thiomicrospira sp.]